MLLVSYRSTAIAPIAMEDMKTGVAYEIFEIKFDVT
jgi:hypothetical protein